MKTTSLKPLTAVVAAVLGLSTAHAHQIWFEQTGAKTLAFRYGELDVNMHEVSPGGLDRFAALTATWLTKQGDRPLPLTKERASYKVPAVAAPGESFVAIDERYPMFDTTRDGKMLRTWWVPSTRWVADFSAQAPRLPLDIVPTGATQGQAIEFAVVYKGDPLPGVKMNLVTPAGWTRSATSDADGKFSFDLPWKGHYVIGIYHTDEVTGERKGADGATEAYQLEGYNAALSFQVKEGLSPLPVAAPTLPASVVAEQAKARAAQQAK